MTKRPLSQYGGGDLLEMWPSERLACKPREKMTVSEWAETYRIVPPPSARAGPWDGDVAPFLREPQDAMGDPSFPRVTMMTSAQIGKTECGMNAALFYAHLDPCPILWVMPRDVDARDMQGARIVPSIKATPQLNELLGSQKSANVRGVVTLGPSYLWFAAAGSSAGLASKPIRLVICDELDKWKDRLGRETGAFELVVERTESYHNRKIVTTSTPTTSTGPIAVEWKQSDQRTFHIPCPKCDTYQPITFEAVGWPELDGDDLEKADQIERDGLAWIACERCDHKLDEGDRRRAIPKGVWCPEGGSVVRGEVTGVATSSAHRGYHINRLYSLLRPLSEVVAAYYRLRHKGKLQSFWNGWLGLPWEIQDASSNSSDIERCRHDYPDRTVQKDAVVLTAGVDVQRHEMYVTVRAWSPGERSRQVFHGMLDKSDWVGLRNLLQHNWPIEGSSKTMPVRKACVDSNYRTDEVYQFCRKVPCAIPIRGDVRVGTGQIYSTSVVDRKRGGRGLTLTRLNVDVLKDKLHRLIHSDEGARWQLCTKVSEQFLRHMVAEHRVIVEGADGRHVSQWQKRGVSTPNHFFDCAVYELAGAEMLNVWSVPDSSDELGIEARPRPPVRRGRTNRSRTRNRRR